MNRVLLERRTKMLRLSLTGVPLKHVITSLSEEYEVEEKLLYHDWERRNTWIPQVVQLNDPTLLHKLLEGAKSVLPKAWLLLEDSENEFVKLGALKLIKDTNLQVLEILQSIGAIEKKPIQVEQVILEWKEQQQSQSTISPTPPSSNSTAAQPGSDASLQADASAKPQPEQTKQSSNQSNVDQAVKAL